MPGNEIIPVREVEVVAPVETAATILNPVGLTEQEQRFCELFASGKAPYAGNLVESYEEAFKCDDPKSGIKAHLLLSKPEVQRYLSEVNALCGDDAAYMKVFLNATLMHIADEMAHIKNLVDRKGNPVSPAPCRAVAVHAAKMLMDLNGLKSGGHEAELKIKNESGGNITFNVIVPNGAKHKEEIGQQQE